jgi:predicted AAA+ superfamily ATPase
LILEFEKYLYRQFFDIIDSDLITAKKYLEKLKNKIIKNDAKKFFNIKYPDLLIKIFDIISENP